VLLPTLRFSRHRTTWTLAALAFGAGLAVAHAAMHAAPESLVLTGARLLDTRGGRYVPAPAVVIVGDRIDAILAETPPNLPPGARRIDLAGKTLVPGLGDMFAWASPDGSTDADFYYAMALAHGVTSYRVVGGRLPWAASQRERVRSGEVLAPRLWIGGLRLDQQGAPSMTMRAVADAAAAGEEVTEQASLGAEWVSVAGTAAPAVHRAVVRAARAAKIRVSGEPGATAAAELIRLGVDAIDRLGFVARSRDEIERELGERADFPRDDRDAATDYLWRYASGADLRPVIPKALRQRIVVIPMLASFNGALSAESLEQDPALQLLSPRWRAALADRAHAADWSGAAGAARAAAARGRLVRAFVAAGARMATGVDVASNGYTVPGAGVHRELALLVSAGLSNAEAIRAATVNCAELVGSEATLGQIKAGFNADLIAVDGDPLARIEDLQRITLIVRGGEVLERDRLLAQARRAIR
jgi:imidazolonepropionase-like amidohydrolase